VRRRDLITSLAATAAAWPLAARAQQKAMPVIGWLYGGSPPPPNTESSAAAAFRKGLSETGYVEGQNLATEFRFAEGHFDRLPTLVADLIGRKVSLIIAVAAVSALAAKKATSTIPIVFAGVNDPIGLGLVASLARPGGNLTGFSNISSQLTPKRLDLLCELLPHATVIALLVDPNNPGTNALVEGSQEAARAKRIQLPILKASTESEIDAAFASLVQMRAGGLVIGLSPFFTGRSDQLVALASHHAVPAMYYLRSFAEAGGLISYADSNLPAFREAGIYAGKILNGEKPRDLPVQQPTTFDLIINLKTAKALGLTVPQALLARADEVIE
jgi:putative ABC transport system substrate-binding protein